MTAWSVPDRVEPPFLGGERAALEGWLDFHRDTLLTKCAGLDGEQLARRSVPPSTLSLLGLVRHLADVERGWFRRTLDSRTHEQVPSLFYGPDNEDGDFDDVDPDRADDDLATYRAELAAAREVAARYQLDDEVISRRGNRMNLRWIMLHMIEEYARHNGHADLLRESIDGVTGD